MYDKVQEDDRVSVHGLTELAPGRALQVSFHHSDGTQDSGEVTHTLNEDQIDWFKAGSALNVLRRHD
jgi:aconitate hydratase